jgi:hypothetical protein
VVLGLGLILTILAAFLLKELGWVAELKDLVPVVSAGIALTALAYLAMTFHTNTEVRVEELRLKRLEYAMNFIERSSAPDMVKAIRVAADIRKESVGKSADEIVQMIENDPAKTEALVMIFNYFERLGIVVRLGAADEVALKEYYSVPIRRYWHLYNSWVVARRNELQTTDLFCEVERLANRWR